jgi:hypothetical protein
MAWDLAGGHIRDRQAPAQQCCAAAKVRQLSRTFWGLEPIPASARVGTTKALGACFLPSQALLDADGLAGLSADALHHSIHQPSMAMDSVEHRPVAARPFHLSLSMNASVAIEADVAAPRIA